MPPEQIWNRRDVVATYSPRRYITPAELRVIAECWSHIAGGHVLDLGVGAGRTTSYLAQFAARYVAIDFMPNMVAEAQRNHPGRDIRQADARELPFSDGEFSFVLFSFNGIDYVEPADRPRILREARRVLAPGGVFAYSTHNLASRDGEPRFSPELPRLSRSPRLVLDIARSMRAAVRGYRNFKRLADQQQIDDEYAFIMDGAHEYSVLTCYVTQAHERRALANAGFEVRTVLEGDGQLATPSSRSRDLYFIVG
jgi:SAM-dependent methyltransferase